MLTVYLGNRDAVEAVPDPDTGEYVRTPMDPGKRCTTIRPPDGIPLGEVFTTITAPARGAWDNHSDGTPAWVAVDSDDPAFAQALATLLSVHYGGCEIRDPDPQED